MSLKNGELSESKLIREWKALDLLRGDVIL